MQPFVLQNQKIQNKLDPVDGETLTDPERVESIGQVVNLVSLSTVEESDIEGLTSLQLRVLEMILNENRQKNGLVGASNCQVTDKLIALQGHLWKKYLELIGKDEAAKAHNLQARILTKIYEAHFNAQFLLTRDRAQQLGASLVLSKVTDSLGQDAQTSKKPGSTRKLLRQLKLLTTLQTDISAQFSYSSGTLEAMCLIVSSQMTKLVSFLFAKTRSSMTFS